jgi:transposase-like protein
LVASGDCKMSGPSRGTVVERGRLRTTNGLKRLNHETKRLTCVAAIIPNDASLLCLDPAVLSEISDDWEPARAYRRMDGG